MGGKIDALKVVVKKVKGERENIKGLSKMMTRERTALCGRRDDLGSCGRNAGHMHNAGHFRPSCVRLVCFIGKSSEFYGMQMDCQKNFIHLSLLISHKPPACDKPCPLPYLLLIPDRYRYVLKVMIYIKSRGVS